MDRRELRRRIEARPNAVRFVELERLLAAYGFEVREARGSHSVYTRGAYRLVVTYRTPHVLAAYVRLALRMITEDDNG